MGYCNVALAGLPSCDLDRLQSVMNAAARLTVGAQRHDHITPLLADLHWLRIPQRIKYKLCYWSTSAYHTGPHRAICRTPSARSRVRNHGVACGPRHRPISSCRRRDVQQWAQDRAFGVAAPRASNSLPDAIRRSSSLAVFKRSLKTYFYTQCFY